jgi:subtilisin family serine protease
MVGDYDGHGTWVAGIIAAIDNGNHLIGVAPKVSLYAIKALDPQTWIDGINWAVSRGVHIISISQGIYQYDADLEAACNNAFNNGVLLIASSGNDNKGKILYPAAFASVIAVGATDQNDDRWLMDSRHGSNYGRELELVAPGADINSTSPPNTYSVDSGTSAAVPHVTGIAALVFGSKIDPEYDLNNNGIWDNTEVREKLRDTALDLGPSGPDGDFGRGLANAWWSSQRPQGNINYDDITDMEDFSSVAYYLDFDDDDPLWWLARPCDININNVVDVVDYTIVSLHYGEIDP